MRVNEDFIVRWRHSFTVSERLSRAGKSIVSTIWLSECSITKTKGENPVTLSKGTFIHEVNKYNRKNGVLQSFKRAISTCQSKDLRMTFWDTFWAIHKPTIAVTEETADLLKCVDYMNYKVKELIQKDESLSYNDGWRAFSRPEVVKRLGNRLQMYRDKSDYSLVAIIKLCIIGFINYKRAKDENKSNTEANTRK